MTIGTGGSSGTGSISQGTIILMKKDSGDAKSRSSLKEDPMNTLVMSTMSYVMI